MITAVTAVLSSAWAMTRREEGQGLAEYALILVFVAIAAILALGFLGGQIGDVLTYVGSQVTRK